MAKTLTEIKNAWFASSLTFWGVLIAFVPVLLTALGAEVPADLGELERAGIDFLNATNELVGFILIAWGRYRAPGRRLVVDKAKVSCAPLAAILAGLVVLTACGPQGRALLDSGVEGVKEVEDNKARVAVQVPCAITIGAKHRVLSEAQQRHVEALCGGEIPASVTPAELREILDRAPP